jgi:hypothetical protein
LPAPPSPPACASRGKHTSPDGRASNRIPLCITGSSLFSMFKNNIKAVEKVIFQSAHHFMSGA